MGFQVLQEVWYGGLTNHGGTPPRAAEELTIMTNSGIYEVQDMGHAHLLNEIARQTGEKINNARLAAKALEDVAEQTSNGRQTIDFAAAYVANYTEAHAKLNTLVDAARWAGISADLINKAATSDAPWFVYDSSKA